MFCNVNSYKILPHRLNASTRYACNARDQTASKNLFNRLGHAESSFTKCDDVNPIRVELCVLQVGYRKYVVIGV